MVRVNKLLLKLAIIHQASLNLSAGCEGCWGVSQSYCLQLEPGWICRTPPDQYCCGKQASRRIQSKATEVSQLAGRNISAKREQRHFEDGLPWTCSSSCSFQQQGGNLAVPFQAWKAEKYTRYFDHSRIITQLQMLLDHQFLNSATLDMFTTVFSYTWRHQSWFNNVTATYEHSKTYVCGTN